MVRKSLILKGNGAPDRIRTCDPCLRRAVLYPAELRVRKRGMIPANVPCVHALGANGMVMVVTGVASCRCICLRFCRMPV